MAKTYSEKLKDPRWQKKRLQIFKRDKWACQFCGDKENTLHVHHKHYEKGKEPWEYENWHLTTLCEDCHKFTHEIKLTPLEKYFLSCLIVRDGNKSARIYKDIMRTHFSPNSQGFDEFFIF